MSKSNKEEDKVQEVAVSSADNEDVASNDDKVTDDETDKPQDESQPGNLNEDPRRDTGGRSDRNESLPEKEDEDESEDEGIGNSSEVLDKSARDALYEKGQQYEAKKKSNLALKCYLQCLKGLAGGAEFTYLPQCLRKVADLYYKEGELEKAIQFIQAEKMYYETALIDTSELQKKVEERKKSQDVNPQATNDPHFANPDVVRADEFENLARMCLEKNQSQLALEYQGKATRLRQKIYGDTHKVTKDSLDLFTVIYGEVGKQQYSESMEKLAKADEDKAQEEEGAEGEETGAGDASAPGSPQSILRRRRNKDKSGSKRVSFVEPDHVREKREQDEWITKAILWVLLFMCMFLLVVIFHYIYCKIDIHSHYCSSLKADLHYYYMRAKYLVYYYYSPGSADNTYG